MKHLVYIPFTGLGLKGGFRGQTWLRNRIEVFKKFTLVSLLHQSNRDFVVWLQWRPEDQDNSQIKKLEKTLNALRDFTFISTYGGLCFEDDKYDRPYSLERLETNLKRTLPELRAVLGEEQTILMTIQPSDDCYLSHAFQEIQDKAKTLNITKPHSIGYRQGYMMNYNTLELAEYANQNPQDQTDKESTYNTYTIPPFFTVVFPRNVFVDPKAHMKWTGPYRSHEYIGNDTTYIDLKGSGFIVGTHGENISTTWTHRYKGRMLEGQEKELVLMQAGLYDAEAITLEKEPKRKLEQKFIDMLPLPLKRRYIRYRSPGIGSAIEGYNYFKI